MHSQAGVISAELTAGHAGNPAGELLDARKHGRSISERAVLVPETRDAVDLPHAVDPARQRPSGVAVARGRALVGVRADHVVGEPRCAQQLATASARKNLENGQLQNAAGCFAYRIAKQQDDVAIFVVHVHDVTSIS